jgi:hypothetical protein
VGHGTTLARECGVRISRPAWSFAVVLASCSVEPPRAADLDAARAPATALHTEQVAVPSVLRGLPMFADDAGVMTVTPCTTCHGAIDATPLPLTAEGIGGPHAGLTVRHGTLRCAACHEQGQRDRLHLADGRSISMIDAMELCAQCHGPQKRDFDHGAHGGMRGYWDRRAGPRTRNHCVSCHDPHAPRFGAFAPVEGPRDRFSSQHAQGEEGEHD